jgi:SEL1 protein
MRVALVLLAACALDAAAQASGAGAAAAGSSSKAVDPEASYQKGLAKLYGTGGERQHVGAGLAMLEDAANAGSVEAAYDLAQFYDSHSHHRDWTKAFKWYGVAAAKGHAPSQSALAYMFETGIGTEEDTAKAVLYHYFASTAGSVPSLMALGYKHMFGLGVPKSCDTAFSYYNPAAEQVIQEEQQPEGSSRFERVRLADSKDGINSGREDEEIIEYYDYAASKGDTKAQLAMGHLHYWGARGLAQDFGAAARWFSMAADGGEAHAMSMLGHMYANGLSVTQNNETALKWFTQAWEPPHLFPGAANGLGYMYMHGMGVEQDYEKALKYFVDASDKNNAEAHFNLGAMYIDGIGVDQDNSKALQHFAVAAGEGHTMALYNLAVMHHNGLGTSRSCDLAVQ